MNMKSLMVGIAAMIVLLIAMAVSALDSEKIKSSDPNNNITIQLLDIKEDREYPDANDYLYPPGAIDYDYTVEYSYGDTIKVKVDWTPVADNCDGHCGYLYLLDAENFDEIERYALHENDAGKKTISISSTVYSPYTHFVIRVNLTDPGTETDLNTSDATTIKDYKTTLIIAEPIEPVISLTLKNPSNLIAKGDNVKIKGTITTTSYNWTLRGPYDINKFNIIARNTLVSGSADIISSGESVRVYAPDHQIELLIPSHIILQNCSGMSGTYTLEVWNEAYPDTTASIDFSIVEPDIEVSADKDEIRLGETLKVFGITNAAETYSEYDNTTIGQNNVTIYVYDE
ncbi:MAG TPA: hypothetical protein EYP30_00345, partial [Archaeoglobaceae archaeon]|nr:hypothetical protein [Archaeoglobaceae archaeon]